MHVKKTLEISVLACCHCRSHSAADVQSYRHDSSIRRSLEQGHADHCKAAKDPQTRQREYRSGKTRLSGLGAALTQRDEAFSLVHVDLCSFYVAVIVDRKTMRCLLADEECGLFTVRTCLQGFLAGEVRLFPVSVTCSKYGLMTKSMHFLSAV